MDIEPTIAPVPSPPRRGTSVIVVLATTLVGLAIIKPWAIGQPTGTSAAGVDRPTASQVAPPGAASALPRPVPAVGPSDPNAMACMSSEGDRVLALQRAPGLEVRTWLTLDETRLAGPLDPAVVPLRLPSSHVIGLGVCARRVVQESTDPSAAQLITVDEVTGGGATGQPLGLLDVGPAVVITRQLGGPTLGVLYGPPATLLRIAVRSTLSLSPGPSATVAGWPTWPAGAYALAFRFPGDSPTTLRWVRLDIVAAVGKYD
jgi:hypothetical protein